MIDQLKTILGNGWILLAAWIITWGLGYLGLGGYLADRIEGIDASMIPILPSILFILAALASLALTVVWASFLGRKQGHGSTAGVSARRRILIGGIALTGGIATGAAATIARLYGWLTVTGPALAPPVTATDPNPHPSWDGSSITGYRELGSTGFKVSDISLGTGQILRHSDPVGLLRSALDRGVNYIDTSPDYAGTRSETAIGKAIVGRRREDLFIATKWCTATGHVRQGSSVATYINTSEASLQRLGTEQVDLVHVHACDTVDRLLDPNLHEAFDRLKEQGKVRFMGVSTHTPNLEEVARAVIDSERFDVMMLAYHHGAWPQQRSLIDQATAKGIGVVAMKTLKGAKHRGMAEFRSEADSYAQAAFKWVLSNPAVACLVVSFFDSQHVDEYLHASGAPLGSEDLAILEKYDQLTAGTHCFAHCGACLGSCPEKIPINDVLRQRMYFEDYGDKKQARQLYARLDTGAELCLDCPGPCSGVCPQGIPIQERMIGAQRQLALT